MSKIKDFFNKIKEQLKEADGRKRFILNSLKFLPAVILFISYIVLICTESYDPRTVLVMTGFVVLLFAVPTVKLLGCKWMKKLLSFGFFFIAPPFIFMIVEALTRNYFWGLPGTMKITLFNVIFYYILAFFVLAVTTRTDVAIIVTALIPSILGIANNLSVQARDMPIYPWDVLSAKTAMSVVGNYEMSFSPDFKFCIFSLIAIIVFAIQLNMRFKFKKLWIGIFPAVASFMMLFGYVSYINNVFSSEENALKHGFYPSMFDAKYLYNYNGTPVTFIYTLGLLDIDPPKGYKPDNIRELYDQYQNAAKEDYEKKADNVSPNIIVIMNEAFSDLSILDDIPTNKDYMPFIHSLIEEDRVKHGHALVSIKGGNTPNSEYEFLTGGSMAFFPAETIPFQQYIEGHTYSVVSQLNSLGYRTIGMHNFYRSGWKRDEVYDMLEFDEKYFLEDMKPIDDDDLIRCFLSDRSMYNRIIDLYENNTDDEPFFLFGVTMQNHGGYTNDLNGKFVPEIKTQYEQEFYATDILDNYLSLIYETDKAYEELINYFSSVDEPTVIVMFGDHQPSDIVTMPIYENSSITDQGTLKGRTDRYKTPYIIWSNYDLNAEAEAPSDVSLNYLGGIVMDLAGIPLTPFQMWQKDLIAEYPTINAFSYTDASGVLNSAAGINKLPMLNTLSQIQYNLIIDRKHTVKEFFQPVTP